MGPTALPETRATTLPGAREARRRLVTGDALVQAPGRLRALVRGSEVGLAALGVAIGTLAGMLVAGIGGAAQLAHEALYGLASHQYLSSAVGIAPWRLLLFPVLGGAALGLLALLAARWRPKGTIVDPIEANALHGGRMSLRDSVLVAAQNLISNGSGASVGLEAGYTQISCAIASRLGLSFELRRADLRMLVGCGAAGAIAGAFGAPLAGAFYAFELIVGTYSVAAAIPVTAAAVAGALAARAVTGGARVIPLGDTGSAAVADYAPAFMLGLACAALAILFMQGVTRVEALSRRSRVPPFARPALGGACVGLLALATPQVLSAGHGAFYLNVTAATTAQSLALVFVLKALASAISLGSGFRGGLFFASLLLGALAGKLFAELAPYSFPFAGMTAETYAVVGMSAFAVAVIGGPLTMTMLALETTGDLGIAGLALVAVLASALATRRTFGYSFATWRFHLRGESIRSAHDVGWIRTLTVGQLMRRDVRRVRGDTLLTAFRRDFPLGSTQRVVVEDDSGRYAGIVLVPDAHAPDLDEAAGTTRVAEIVRYPGDFLLPHQNAKEAAALFDRAESEALAVVDGRDARRVLGLLTEAHTLRRYSEELDRRRREASGEA